MTVFRLFLSFAKIGLFAFGGGYATLPLIGEEIVASRGWLTYPEFLEVVTISQLTPGPIAINAATFVGYRVGGVGGSVVATLGFCLLPFLLVLGAAGLLRRYRRITLITDLVYGLRPAVIALIAAAAYSIVAQGRAIPDVPAIVIAVAAFLVIRSRKLDPILVLGLAGLAGVIVYR